MFSRIGQQDIAVAWYKFFRWNAEKFGSQRNAGFYCIEQEKIYRKRKFVWKRLDSLIFIFVIQ